MGNAATRDPLKRLQEENLTDEYLKQLEQLLYVYDKTRFEEGYKAFTSKYAPSISFKDMFPIQSLFKPAEQDGVITQEKRLLNEVIQKVTHGFSSSEYKLNQLQQGDFRNFEFNTIKMAEEYEQIQQKKSVILITLYLARSKGGGAESRQTLLEYFKESTKSSDSKNAQLSMRIGSLFNPKCPLKKLEESHIESYYSVLKDQIREMLGAWNETETLLHDGISAFEVDLQLLSVREILTRALDDEKSGHSTKEIKELCLRLMTRMGVLTKNAETLLMASYYSTKFNVNISLEIMPILAEEERFEKPEREIVKDDFSVKLTTVREKVALTYGDDLSNQIVMSYDTFAEDKTHFYNYSAIRGLTRAKKGPLGDWKEVEKVNTDVKGWSGVSIVIHQGELLVRHAGIKDKPFVVFDKDTLQQTEKVYKHPEGDEHKLKKLDWSEEKLPKEEQDEEIKMTEEQKAEEERKRPWRKIGATPLASDGKFIYALSMQLKTEDENEPAVCEKQTVEVFELTEEGEVKRENEFDLKKDADNNWLFKRKKYLTEEGYYDHAQIACNGRVFIINFPHRTHFFKVEDGTRISSADKNKTGQALHVVCNSEDATLSAFEVNRLQGKQYSIKVDGYEKRLTEEQKKKQLAPEVLRKGKDKIQAELDKGAEARKNPDKLNMYEQLIAGKVDTSKLLTQATENLKNQKESKVADLQDLQQAVILTTMAAKADQFDVELDKLGQNTVIGEALMKYFRHDNCIFLTKTMFRFLLTLTNSLLERVKQGEVNSYVLASLSSLTTLVKINMRCLTICKINLDQIISKEEYENFFEMRNRFEIVLEPSLDKTIEARAKEAVALAEKAIKEKEEKDKAEEAKRAAEVEEEKKKQESEEVKPVLIKTDGSKSEPVSEAKEEEKPADKKEDEPEEEELETKEQVEERWKDTELYAKALKKQVQSLQTILSQIYNSSEPSSRMQALANNLESAQSGNEQAKKSSSLTFEAITTDKLMREILRGSKEHFEHFKRVIKVCFELTQKKQLREMTQAEQTVGDIDLKLEQQASAFLQCYIRQHCSMYADLTFEMNQTEVPPKKEKKDGEDEEEEDDETKEKRKRNEEAKAKFDTIQPQLFYSFITLTEKFGEQLDVLQEHLSSLEGQPVKVVETFEGLTALLGDSQTFLRAVQTMILFFNFITLDVTWLDEVAEGLKNVISASDRFRIYIDGLDFDVEYKAKQQPSWEIITKCMRQCCYTMGIVANQLIRNPKEKEAKEEDPETKKNKIDFKKLIMLQGGLEMRFIPELSDETKKNIEGFFKITQDEEMRDLTLKKSAEIEHSDDDKLLMSVIDKTAFEGNVAIDGVNYLELTLDLLQHIVQQRKGPLMRVGGQNGLLLARSTFAVIIKFSEQTELLRSLWEEVELVGMGLDPDLKGPAKMNELAKEIRENKGDELDLLCKQYEQASQIRKWTQELKKDLVEKFKKECSEQLIAEINEKIKKEKEQKAEQESKGEAASSEADNAKDQTKDSDKDKPEEEKKASKEEKPAQDDKAQKEEKKDEEEDEAEQDEFTGPLSDEQQQVVEDRAFAKMEVKLAETIKDSIDKARFLLKMMIPEAFAKQKSEDLQREMSRKLSQNIQLESKGSGLVRAPSIKKRQSILVVEDTLNRKDTEFDWKDRLKQWNQVQLSLGTITSFSQLDDSAFKSIPLSVISLMQASHTAAKLKEEVEKVMVQGLRRSAGLNLISFAIRKTIGVGTFKDILQWFLTSLRGNRHNVAHYSDDISGCGDSVLSAIRAQFFKVIKVIITKIKEIRDKNFLIHMLDALIWNYNGADLEYLAKYDVFGVLEKGDGGRTHPIALAWGKQIRQVKQNDDRTLTRKLMNTFEFLFKQVLSQVILIDTQGDDQAAVTAAKKPMANEQVSYSASQSLVSSVFRIIFANMRRYMSMIKHFDSNSVQFFINLNNSEAQSQDEKDELADDKVFFDEQGGADEVRKAHNRSETINEVKMKLLCRKVREQVKTGKSDYCVKLADLLSKWQSRATADQVLKMALSRNKELFLAIRGVSFEELSLEEPDQQTIDRYYKLQFKSASKDEYKKIQANLKKLMQSMNQKLVDLEYSPKVYTALYRKFVEAIPEIWSYMLYEKSLDKYWSDSGNFNKEEFLSVDKCKGVSELQPCIAKQADQDQNDDLKGEDEQIERRSKRKDLCKRCFWSATLINILDNGEEFDEKSHFAKMLKDLSSISELIQQDPDKTLTTWLEEVKSAVQEPEGQLEVDEKWFILLHQVKEKEASGVDQDAGENAQEPKVQAEKEQKDDKDLLMKRISKLRKMKKESQGDQKKPQIRLMYHESFFFRIIGLLEFYSSLALVSPAALALVQHLADPNQLNMFIQYLVGGLSRGKIIMLRIFQDLMKLDFPTEIFDRAVQISLDRARKGEGNDLEVELLRLVEAEHQFDLQNLAFFRLVYSMIVDVQETVWNDNMLINSGRHVLNLELARIFKSLPKNGEKNLFIQKLVSSKLAEVLLKIEKCSGAEIEAIMAIVAETGQNQIHVGSSCANPKNQVFTVLGFSNKNYQQAKQKPQDITFNLHFDPSNDMKYVYGLFFDPNSPERQEIIDCEAREVRMLRDINEASLFTAAKNSPLQNAEVVKHFIRVLQGEVTCTSSFVQSVLRNYIIRGFNNMIQILRNGYIQFLSEEGVSKDLLSFIVKNSSKEVKLAKDAHKTTITQSEIKIDQMRIKALTSETSLKKSTPHKLYFSETHESLLVMIQEGKTVSFSRIQAPQFHGFESRALKNMKINAIKAPSQVKLGNSKKNFLLLDSSSLNELDAQIITILQSSTSVLTDDGFKFPEFVSRVESLIEESQDNIPIASTSFITIGKEAFSSLLESVQSDQFDLTKKAASYKGFTDDEFTKVFSTFYTKGSKILNPYMKQLIDFKRPCDADESKTATDLIEDKVIALIKQASSGEDFKKKKEETKKAFCIVTGKKFVEEDEEKKDEESKDAVKKADEEKKRPIAEEEKNEAQLAAQEEKKDDEKPVAVFIDTSDGASKIKEEQKDQPQQAPMVGNQAESDVQRALQMSDELNNHATIVFEQHDEDEQEPDTKMLQDNFVESTRYPTRKDQLNQLYAEEMEYYENLQCRSTFFNMLAFGYKSYDMVAKDLDMTNDNYKMLQNLIFNELCETQYQNNRNNDKELLEVCKGKIQKMYVLFFNEPSFEKFAVEDMISRGVKTIKAIRKDPEFDLDELKISDMADTLKGQEVSDPLALNFLTKQLISMEKISFKHESTHLVHLFEIFLCLSILFGADLKQKVSEELLQTCLEIITQAKTHIADIEDNEKVLNAFFNNQLIRWTCSGLNFESTFKLNKRKHKLMMIQTAMYNVQGLVLERIGKKIEVAAKINRFITEALKQRSVFEDGKSFGYLQNSLQLKHLLNSEEDRHKVSDASIYVTDKKMWKVPISFKIHSHDSLLKIHINKLKTSVSLKLRSDKGLTMQYDTEKLKDGFKNFIMDANSTVEVNLVYGSQVIHYGSSNYSCQWDKAQYEDKIKALQLRIRAICCSQSNALFLTEDDELYGVGDPNNWSRKWDDCYSQKKTWKHFDKPSDCEEIIKIAASTSIRLALTSEGQLFCQGENLNQYIDKSITPGETHESFINCTEVFPLEDSEQIVDMAATNFATYVITDQGNVYGAGHCRYRCYAGEQYDQSWDPPYKIELPGRAVKIWGSKCYSVAWVQVEDDSGNLKMFSGLEFTNKSETQPLIHLGDGCHPHEYDVFIPRAPWAQMLLPQGIKFKKICNGGNKNSFALEQNGTLWCWGQNMKYNDYYCEERSASNDDFLPNYKDNWTPVKMTWFEKNGVKVLDVDTGEWSTILKVQEKNQSLAIYGMVHPDYYYEADYLFGDNKKVLFEKTLYKLEGISAGDILDFSCGSYMFNLIRKPVEKTTSIIPGRKEPSGLTHAYRQDSQWKFVAEDEYEVKKDELPALSFAIRYPITNFEQKAVALPDLEDVASKLGLDQEISSFEERLKSSFSGYVIDSDEIVYCSAAKINGKEQRLCLTKAEAFDANSTLVMNPLIYYRIAKPVKDVTKLPILNLNKFYERTQNEEEQIKFSVKKIAVGTTIKSFIDQISNKETRKNFEELMKFRIDDDRQLMRSMDKYIADELKDKDISEVQVEDFDFKKFDLKNERLKTMNSELLQMRAELFLKFTKQFIQASKGIKINNEVQPDTLEYYFMKNKHLALGSAKDKILEQQLDNIGTGYGSGVSINRNKASVFETEGKVDHEGTTTIFGQFFQACKSNDPSYANFRQKGVDARCWSANFVGEGSIDAGGPFRESLDNIAKELESAVLPLLIKTSNNRNDHGLNRDCFMLNPSSRSPTHLEMYKFFGAFLSFFIMTKAPVPIHLAPSVWKQLLGDELDMYDLEGFDAYSSQVLIDLRDHSSKLSDEEFNKSVKLQFKTILSNGEEVNLKPGEEMQTVTKDNLTEYINLVMKTRFEESKEQMDAMREGVKLVFTPELLPVLSIMDWEQVESRACGQKTIEVDKLKAITRYEGASENSAIIKRFWRVFTSFDDDQRQMYLKFVWGRSRLPIDTSKLSDTHDICVSRHMKKDALPQAHTCFFSIDLPQYPTEKIMRSKLLTAITLCGEIDTDGSPMQDFNGDRIRGGYDDY